jgi:rubrerythrin
MQMNGNADKDPLERLTRGYELMFQRVHEFLDRTEQEAAPRMIEALRDAREKAVELGELSREEAERIAGYIERDVRDAADFISETGQDFRDWFRFDWELVEQRTFDWFAQVADRTSLELRALAERARQASEYRTGEITGPGTLVCQQCGATMQFKQAGHIPPCAKCKGTRFQREHVAATE